MTSLKWRTATSLRLIAKIIPDPRNPALLLDCLNDVLIAPGAGCLYVDPRREGDRGQPGVASDIFAIPIASVTAIAYRE